MESQQKNEERHFPLLQRNKEKEQKNEEKHLQLQKENKEKLFQSLQGNKEKEQENEEKQQRFFFELQKQEELLFKSLITSQQIVLQFSLKMLCGMRSKHLSMHQMKIRPSRHITEDMKISILPTVPIGLMLKKFGYYYES